MENKRLYASILTSHTMQDKPTTSYTVIIPWYPLGYWIDQLQQKKNSCSGGCYGLLPTVMNINWAPFATHSLTFCILGGICKTSLELTDYAWRIFTIFYVAVKEAFVFLRICWVYMIYMECGISKLIWHGIWSAQIHNPYVSTQYILLVLNDY